MLSPMLANASRAASNVSGSVENINRGINNVSRVAPGRIQRLTTALDYLRERQSRAFDEKRIGQYNIAIRKTQNELTRLQNLPPRKFIDRMREANTSTRSLASGFRGLIAAAGAFAILRSSERAFKDQVVAETKLQAVMRNTMGASEDQVQSIIRLASEQQKLGVIGDEVQLAGAQELATYLEKKESLEKLLPAMNDMLAQQYGLNASQEQAAQIATMLGKVMDGQVGALSRYGYKFDEAQEKILKNGTEQQRAAVLYDVVAGAVGGVNRALAQTPEGRLQQQANELGDMQERLGKVIVTLKHALIPIAEMGMALVDDYLMPAFEWIGKNADIIAKLAGIVLGAVVAYKSIALAVSVWSSVTAVWTAITKAGTVAQWSLNSAMLANPIGLIIAAIAVLIGYITLAINKFDSFGSVMLFLMGPIGMIVNAIVLMRRNWDSVVSAFKDGGILAGLKRIGLVLLDTILYPVQQLLSLLSNIPGLGHLAAKGAAHIEGLRNRLNLVSDKEKEEKKDTGLSPQGSLNPLGATSTGGDSVYDPGKTVGAIAGGGAKETNITINLNREMVGSITINPITMTQGADDIRALLVDALSRVLNSANNVAIG